MIDDNPFFARHVERMCADLIAGEGGAWGWSRTAAEGIAQVGVLSPALVLLDPTMHEDGHLLAGYCRELAATAAPATPAFLFLTNPVHQLDQVLSRLTTDDRLTVGTLSKPFGPQDLTEKIAALLAVTPPSAPTPTPTSAMPDVPAAPASRFSWLTTTPEVSGYAHLDAAGTVLEWSGEEKDRGPHGALVYLQRLARPVWGRPRGSDRPPRWIPSARLVAGSPSTSGKTAP